MTKAEFDRAVSQTRLQDRAIDMARMVLVEGHTKAEAARQHGVTRAAAGMAVARVEREHRAIVGCPPGWEVITIMVPPHRVLDALAIQRDELEALENGD